MSIINRIADFHSEMVEWRHDLHAHPETAFEERRTSDKVAQLLQILRHRGRARHRQDRDHRLS